MAPTPSSYVPTAEHKFTITKVNYIPLGIVEFAKFLLANARQIAEHVITLHCNQDCPPPR
jgi:hypothetical protein